MPTQITKTYSTEAPEAYHQAVLKMIKTARLLEKDPAETIKIARHAWLSMVTNQFYADYDVVRQVAMEAGLNEELTRPELRALMQHLGKDHFRGEHYEKTLERCASKDEPELPPLIELEQLYEHYLYCEARRKKGLGMGLPFDTWRYTDDCHTFYDEL